VNRDFLDQGILRCGNEVNIIILSGKNWRKITKKGMRVRETEFVHRIIYKSRKLSCLLTKLKD